MVDLNGKKNKNNGTIVANRLKTKNIVRWDIDREA